MKLYNKTIVSFDYKKYLIKDYSNWVLLLNKNQFTLGSLVLICKDNSVKFSNISNESFSEMNLIVKDIESKLKRVIPFKKINYLMLMMVDPNVHFHVIPRYEKINYNNFDFEDPGWPGKPNLEQISDVSDDTIDKLRLELISEFK